MTMTIRMNAARSDVTVQEGDSPSSTIHFNRDKEEHREEVCQMVESRLRQKAKEAD